MLDTLQSHQLTHDNYLSGYYQVGDQKFVNKTLALIESERTGQYPSWHFFNDVYSKINWLNPPHTDIKSLYQQRARQLREKYDYISISFSGGSDSFTIIKSFIDSGTHIDEIFVRWPIKATDKHPLSKDTHSSNILSEWKLTILPQLDLFKKQLSETTKITIIDWSDRILKDENIDIDWQHNQDFFNPGVRIKYDTVTDHALKQIESGKKVAIVFGVDKPQLLMQEGQIYCYFLDKLAHNHAHHPFDQYCELFYWSKDLPEIVSCQSRLIYRYLEMNPHLVGLIDWRIPYDRSRKNIWDAIVRKIVYPDFDADRWFQAGKPTSLIHNEVDTWMLQNHMDSKFMQSWTYVIDNHFKSLNQRFFEMKNGRLIGLVGFLGGKYLLGPAPKIA